MPVANPPDYMPSISQLVAIVLAAACSVPCCVLLVRHRTDLWKHLSAMGRHRDYVLALASATFLCWSMWQAYPAPVLAIPVLVLSALFVRRQRLLGQHPDIVVSYLYFVFTLNLFVAFCWLLNRGYHVIMPQGDHQEGLFFLYRSMWFASGVSPTLPLIVTFSGLAYGAWVHLQRQLAFLERRPAPPSLNAAQQGLLGRIENTLNHPVFSKRELILGCALGVIVVNTVRVLRHNQTLEGSYCVLHQVNSGIIRSVGRLVGLRPVMQASSE
jgi:hypothetical protein